MIDIIYKIIMPKHLKKLQIKQNIKNLIFQVIFVFSDWILIKQIIVSSTPFCYWGKEIFERMLPGGMSNFFLPRNWWRKLGDKFWVAKVWVKMPWINSFCRKVYSINLKLFPTWWNVKVWEKIQQAFWIER